MDVPLGLQLERQGLGESLDGPLGSAVDGEGRDALLAPDRSDLLDHAARGLLLAHDLERLLGDGHEAEEIHFHLGAGLFLRDFFEDAAEAVAGVVGDDVDATEGVDGFLECGFDLILFCDIEFDGEEVLRLVSRGIR